jgi:alpha-1,6-mannosyltransferase
LIIILPVYFFYFYFIVGLLKSKTHSLWNILIVLTFGFLFRIVLIDKEPCLSDDVYRYLWDGKVSAVGINPYQYPPNHEQLENLRDTEIYSNLNYPEIATVYPPVAQFFFLINEYLGGSLISWKIILLILELILTILLLKMASFFQIDKMRVMIFTLNPLLIIETYMNGHLEIMGLLFLWIVFYSFYLRRAWLASVFIALATLVKFIPALISIPFSRPHFWRKFVLIISIGILIVLPFTCSGVIPMSGFFSYVNRWSFNGAMRDAQPSLMSGRLLCSNTFFEGGTRVKLT